MLKAQLKDEALLDVSHNVFVSHYDCEDPEDATQYSISEVPSCNLAEADIETNLAHVTMYQRNPITTINGTTCKMMIQTFVWYCGWNDHSIIVDDYNTATIPYKISAENCKQAATSGHIKVAGVSIKNRKWVMEVPVKLGERTTYVHREGAVDKLKAWKIPDCDGYGFIYKYSFVTEYFPTTLKFNALTNQVLKQQWNAFS